MFAMYKDKEYLVMGEIGGGIVMLVDPDTNEYIYAPKDLVIVI